MLIYQLQRQAGATLIEVIIALAIMGLLLSIGATDFLEWIQNTQIRTVTEAVQSGIAFARSEAIKRNEPVQIVFTPDYHGWTVVLPSGPTNIRQENGLSEFSAISIVPDQVGSNIITFTSLGRVLQINNDNSLPFSRLQIDNTKMDPGDSQELEVRISTAGNVRMCNPNKVAPDPRAC